MSEITTTSWLIWTLSWIQSKKLKYNSLINKLEIEIEESELVRRLMKWKAMLKELEQEEIEIKKQWIDILNNAGINKFEANGIEVRKKTSVWRLVIDNEDNLSEYTKEVVKTTKTIDKKAIKEDLKQWLIIDWVHLEKDVTLEIKFK